MVEQQHNNNEEEWGSDEEQHFCAIDDGLIVSMTTCQDLDQSQGLQEADVCLRIEVPKHSQARRAPVDICCCIDVSGSMREIAEYESTVTGKMINDGMDMLDIVKHAVKAVMFTLGPEDRISLVTFAGKAKLDFPLTRMADAARILAVTALEKQGTRGLTDIWLGLHTSMESLREENEQDKKRTKTIMLLTDGVPNVSPKNGHISELQNYKDQYPNFECQINTFGFGYTLDSQLLIDLAKEGNGTFGFIPDALIVGTNFVNSVANILSSYCHKTTLRLVLQPGCSFVGDILGFEKSAYHEESWGRMIDIGPLQFGSPREIVIPMKIPAGENPYLEAVITFPREGRSHNLSIIGADRVTNEKCIMAYYRSLGITKALTYLHAIDTNGKYNFEQNRQGGSPSKKDFLEFAEELTLMAEGMKVEPEEGQKKVDLSDLELFANDFNGRLSKAFDGQARLKRWGKHYILAFTRSHQLMQQTNYMDLSLQAYGGPFFQKLQKDGTKAFQMIPFAKPFALIKKEADDRKAQEKRLSSIRNAAEQARERTRFREQQELQNQQRQRVAPVPQTATYYAPPSESSSTYQGCFGASSTVSVVRDNVSVVTPIFNVRKGDQVSVSNGEVTTVECLVKIARDSAKPLISLAGGLMITPGHPIRVNGTWILPKDLSSEKVAHSGFVYNLVLKSNHILLVNGVECITWGHHLNDQAVKHAYFGTDRILRDLAALPGWNTGFVTVMNGLNVRKHTLGLPRLTQITL